MRVHDPRAREETEHDLASMEGDIAFVEDPYEAAYGAHAVTLVTQWQQYRDLDYGRILGNMMRPAYLFDGRNHLDHQYLFNLGYNVFPLGSAPLTHL